MKNKIKVAIIGTGNIGTDLLLKLLKLDWVEVRAFVGRRNDSDGIKIAQQKGVFTTDVGIKYFLEENNLPQVVFDCTNAKDAKENSQIFKRLGIKVIDLTPSKVGAMCIPSDYYLNFSDLDNINMITCGGQTSVPLLNVISENWDISYIEVVSQIASKSAGMATRINIDNYIQTTEKAIQQYTGCENVKVILNLNPAEPEVDMQTTLFIKFNNWYEKSTYPYDNWLKLKKLILDKIKKIQQYIPGYELVVEPKFHGQTLIIGIKVKGSGDYLPPYAGNLDIINCASIKILKDYYEDNNN